MPFLFISVILEKETFKLWQGDVWVGTLSLLHRLQPQLAIISVTWPCSYPGHFCFLFVQCQKVVMCCPSLYQRQESPANIQILPKHVTLVTIFDI